MFQQFVDDLRAFLQPYDISINKVSIFEEVLLVSAGVDPAQTICQFGKKNECQLYLRIANLSDNQANQLLTFLNDKLVKTQAIKEIVSTMTIPNSSQKTIDSQYYFSLDQACVNQYLLPYFKQQFLKFYDEKIAGFELLSINRSHSAHKRKRDDESLDDERAQYDKLKQQHAQTLLSQALDVNEQMITKIIYFPDQPVDSTNKARFSTGKINHYAKLLQAKGINCQVQQMIPFSSLYAFGAKIVLNDSFKDVIRKLTGTKDCYTMTSEGVTILYPNW